MSATPSTSLEAQNDEEKEFISILKKLNVPSLKAFQRSLKLPVRRKKDLMIGEIIKYYRSGVLHNDRVRKYALKYSALWLIENRSEINYWEVYDLIEKGRIPISSIGSKKKHRSKDKEDVNPKDSKRKEGFDYKFKPFYNFEIIQEIHSSPQVLIDRKCEFSFTLTPKEEELIRRPGHRVYVLSASATKVKNNVPITFPKRFQLTINDHELPPVHQGANAQDSASPIDITKYLRESPSVNHIECSFLAYVLSVIFVYIVKQTKPEKFVENLLDQGTISLDKFFGSKNDDGLTFEDIVVSLLDPMTKARIAVPAITTKCNHSTPFDAMCFLDGMYSKCPTCNTHIVFEEIRIVKLLYDIVQSDKNVETVRINSQGQWTAVDRSNAFKSGDAEVDVVCLSDEEDEGGKQKGGLDSGSDNDELQSDNEDSRVEDESIINDEVSYEEKEEPEIEHEEVGNHESPNTEEEKEEEPLRLNQTHVDTPVENPENNQRRHRSSRTRVPQQISVIELSSSSSSSESSPSNSAPNSPRKVGTEDESVVVTEPTPISRESRESPDADRLAKQLTISDVPHNDTSSTVEEPQTSHPNHAFEEPQTSHPSSTVEEPQASNTNPTVEENYSHQPGGLRRSDAEEIALLRSEFLAEQEKSRLLEEILQKKANNQDMRNKLNSLTSRAPMEGEWFGSRDRNSSVPRSPMHYGTNEPRFTNHQSTSEPLLSRPPPPPPPQSLSISNYPSSRGFVPDNRLVESSRMGNIPTNGGLVPTSHSQSLSHETTRVPFSTHLSFYYNQLVNFTADAAANTNGLSKTMDNLTFLKADVSNFFEGRINQELADNDARLKRFNDETKIRLTQLRNYCAPQQEISQYIMSRNKEKASIVSRHEDILGNFDAEMRNINEAIEKKLIWVEEKQQQHLLEVPEKRLQIEYRTDEQYSNGNFNNESSPNPDPARHVQTPPAKKQRLTDTNNGNFQPFNGQTTFY
ncbi:hypothetical protein G210_3137 [Candida maltosa Xu316]|uniref:PINIT domain-containing protein n=1 Tax=Candida maltosa (strain Xu316) TaxID=1245528 RepID=M3J3X4_CANMX|nr:hypothetical protein G210_3137 [Candida maltosa Xu316]